MRAVEGNPARAEVRFFVGLLVCVCLVWGAWLVTHRMKGPSSPELLPWQRAISTSSASDQRLYRALREAIVEAENRRSSSGAWPAPQALAEEGIEPFAEAGAQWTLQKQGSYVNYVGVSAGNPHWRWLVLFIEPDEAARREPPPPVDEEHHTLPDGTSLHVTVWTEDPGTSGAEKVYAFPATEGWVQQIGQ